MWINVPDEQVVETENLLVNLETFSDVAIKSLLAKYSQLFAEALRTDAEHKELDKYSRPRVPMDVPEPVWNAIANLYSDQTEHGWTPAPNHHVEYRDCRAAYIATLQYVAEQVNPDKLDRSGVADPECADYIWLLLDDIGAYVPDEPAGG